MTGRSTTRTPRRRRNTGYDLVADPESVAQGGVVELTVPDFPPAGQGDSTRYVALWSARGAGTFEGVGNDLTLVVGVGPEEVAVTFPTEADGASIRWIAADTAPGTVRVRVKAYPLADEWPTDHGASVNRVSELWVSTGGGAVVNERADVTVTAPYSVPVPLPVTLRRAEVEPDVGQAHWAVIRATTEALSFDNYRAFLNDLFCGPGGDRGKFDALAKGRGLPFPDTDLYRVLKVATELFMQVNCGVLTTSDGTSALTFEPAFLSEEVLRVYRRITGGDINSAWRQYVDLVGKRSTDPQRSGIIPYLQRVLENVSGVPFAGGTQATFATDGDGDWARLCEVLIQNKLTRPCFVELIWSYWHEEGMLVQTMKAVSLRFQNRRWQAGRDPLAMLELDPLRPLNNLLWGYIQDEQHRLTVARRAYEYDHHYGITLLGDAVPPVRGADTRSRFLEAFHNLLQLCTVFFKEDDDTTVIADGFPLLNALREVHLLLVEGAHNQYRDLPWTSRQEMLMEQWMLSRPEFREFLPRRPMVDYPEAWMHSVEAMKTLQGWTDSSILHFRDLARFGERLLLSIRFGNWTVQIHPQAAANWARYFRAEIQGYIHAYRAVTGVDLTDYVDATLPAVLLQQRMADRPAGPRLPGRIPASISARRGGRALPVPAAQPAMAAPGRRALPG